MILPIVIVAYLGIGLFRTQPKTVNTILDPKNAQFFKNEPIWHAALWPLGFFVAGK